MLIFVFLLSHRGQACTVGLVMGDFRLLSLQGDTCFHLVAFAPSVLLVASIEMSVTVDNAKLLDLTHLL